MERDYSRCGGEKTWPEIIWRHRKLVVKPMIHLDCSFCERTFADNKCFLSLKLVWNHILYTYTYTDEEKRSLQEILDAGAHYDFQQSLGNPWVCLTPHMAPTATYETQECQVPALWGCALWPLRADEASGDIEGRGRLRWYLRCQQTLLRVLLLVLLQLLVSSSSNQTRAIGRPGYWCGLSNK